LLGIPGQDLIIENQSRTTFENAMYTKKIIDTLKLRPPFVLVTSAMHVPRAEQVFTKAGLPVIAFPSDYRVLNKKFYIDDYIIPENKHNQRLDIIFKRSYWHSWIQTF
jgi:uncharacterized SAM-binding protein YcdF (DUF218 family)